MAILLIGVIIGALKYQFPMPPRKENLTYYICQIKTSIIFDIELSYEKINILI